MNLVVRYGRSRPWTSGASAKGLRKRRGFSRWQVLGRPAPVRSRRRERNAERFGPGSSQVAHFPSKVSVRPEPFWVVPYAGQSAFILSGDGQFRRGSLWSGLPVGVSWLVSLITGLGTFLLSVRSGVERKRS